MRLVNKYILQKLKSKNLGNAKLTREIDKLIEDLEYFNLKTPLELIKMRPDAYCVYGGEFYFFNINVHRTMILIEFEDDGEMTVVWAGTHKEYELTFKNNRNVIKKWLKNNGWI